LAEWKQVIAVENIRDNEINEVSVDDLHLVMVKDAGDIFAYRDECPHEQQPLSQGALEDGLIICSRHLWEFEVRTGQHLTHLPMVERNLVQYPVRVVAGTVEVDVASPRRWSGNKEGEKSMPTSNGMEDLSSRLAAIADEVMEASKLETDELSAHLWILRSVTIRDYAESVASLQARTAREQSR
jgi:toluene monooxygenase system ferredoxin subunit